MEEVRESEEAGQAGRRKISKMSSAEMDQEMEVDAATTAASKGENLDGVFDEEEGEGGGSAMNKYTRKKHKKHTKKKSGPSILSLEKTLDMISKLYVGWSGWSVGAEFGGDGGNHQPRETEE